MATGDPRDTTANWLYVPSTTTANTTGDLTVSVNSDWQVIRFGEPMFTQSTTITVKETPVDTLYDVVLYNKKEKTTKQLFVVGRTESDALVKAVLEAGITAADIDNWQDFVREVGALDEDCDCDD